jgi:hypothetical protein
MTTKVKQRLSKRKTSQQLNEWLKDKEITYMR